MKNSGGEIGANVGASWTYAQPESRDCDNGSSIGEAVSFGGEDWEIEVYSFMVVLTILGHRRSMLTMYSL